MSRVAETQPADDGTGAFDPVAVVDLEVTGAPPTPVAGGLLGLVRVHGTPVGQVRLPSGGDGEQLRAAAVAGCADTVRAHLVADGLEVADLAGADLVAAVAASTGPCASRPQPPDLGVSVVVCTLGSDPRLTTAVRSVLDQSSPARQVVVVDNDPVSGGVRRLLADVDDARLTVVDEPRRGLSSARNAGLRVATGEVVAFTDDDALADPDWLLWLTATFAEPEVVCATGLVLPASITTRAQAWFEEFGAFDKGFEPLRWDLEHRGVGVGGTVRAVDGGALFPYAAGVFGSGNNMAFRAAWLRTQPGVFDEALGAGTPSRGGEDLDAFLAVMLSGGVLAYEPRALVRHHARSTVDELRRQMFGYGSGMSAVITKNLVARPGAVLRRVPAGLRRLLDPGSAKNSDRSATYPRTLVLDELRGYVAGPALLARGRFRERRGSRAGAGVRAARD